MKFEFLNNDVCALNQFPAFYYTEGNNLAKIRVMFIGNSITIHEQKPEIGWNKTCGMAASDLEHDYVHIVNKFLIKKYDSSCICVCNGGGWELDYINNTKANSIISLAEEFQPDIVILRIGENFNKDYLKERLDPFIAFDYLLKEIKKITNQVIVTSLFWKNDYLDNKILQACKVNNAIYVDLLDLSDDKSNEAIGQFENQSVSFHPNDKGMKEIANRIIKVL